MGTMKRIATARQWNPSLTGGRLDTEIAAMRKLAAACLDRHSPPPPAKPNVVRHPKPEYQGELPF